MQKLTKKLLCRLAAESIGTFTIVFAGCGSIMVHSISPSELPISLVAVIFGLAVTIMIYALGHISGAHFNPAVTIAFASVKRFLWKEVPFYLFAQITGALFAILLLSIMLPETSTFGGTKSILLPYQAFMWEIILTFFLMFVIISVATDSRAVGIMAGAAIGATVMLGAFIGGPVTGAAMNPARYIAPAMFENNFADIWIYVIAPCLGAVIAAFIYEKIRCETNNDFEKVKNKAGGCC